jgi:hypothetical protein
MDQARSAFAAADSRQDTQRRVTFHFPSLVSRCSNGKHCSGCVIPDILVLPHFHGGLVPDLLTYSSHVDIVDQVQLLTFNSAQETTKNGGEIWQSRVWYPMS